MDHTNYYRGRLAEHLDANGDIVPPWAQYPDYECGTIGWRMGSGEDWLTYWHLFLDTLDPAFDVRLAYLKRHPPAPVSWADAVLRVLHPTHGGEQDDERDEDDQREAQRRAELYGLGLVASDASYPIWRDRQQTIDWPWAHSETPQSAARYFTRDLWFWSRHVTELRSAGLLDLPALPEAWEPCAEPLRTGQVPAPDTTQGLLVLAQMLAAGAVVPPWRLGLTPGDFADTFDLGMGYVDAFRLWIMSAFDDNAHLRRCLGHGVPAEWEPWLAHQFRYD